MSTALHVFRLRHLCARIHASLYSDMNTNVDMDNPTWCDQVARFRTEIEDWLSSTPPIPARTGIALSIFATKDWYDLNYSETIIMLYRGQLAGHQEGVKDDVFFQCARAAERICHGYRRQYIGKPVNCTWGTLHVIFSAGLTYLHCLWTSAAVRDETRYDEMSSTFKSCTMLLVVMAERWKNAAPYRDMFEALCNRTTKMMSERSRDQSELLSSGAGSDEMEVGSFTQWMADISDVGMSDGINSLLNGLITDFLPQDDKTEA
ncbi:hypothetical protein ACJ41O_014472 [Fusarium nematophilum]